MDAIPVLRLRGAPALGIFSGSRRVPCGVSQCRGINGGQSLRPQQQLNHPRKEGGGRRDFADHGLQSICQFIETSNLHELINKPIPGS